MDAFLFAAEILPIPGFTEPVSSLTHLFGAGLFLLLGGTLLWLGRGASSRAIFLGIYALSCVFLLAMSGVYHMLDVGSTARAVLGRLDHSAIFILIAGTFTPAHGILFHGIWRWGPLVLIWSIAIAGVTLKTIFFDDIPEWLGLSLYLGMGWLGAVSGSILWFRFGTAFIKPLLLGGLAYSLGGALDFLRWPMLVPGILGPHELFHVAVLIGAAYHWRFTCQFAVGVPADRRYQVAMVTGAARPVSLSERGPDEQVQVG